MKNSWGIKVASHYHFLVESCWCRFYWCKLWIVKPLLTALIMPSTLWLSRSLRYRNANISWNKTWMLFFSTTAESIAPQIRTAILLLQIILPLMDSSNIALLMKLMNLVQALLLQQPMLNLTPCIFCKLTSSERSLWGHPFLAKKCAVSKKVFLNSLWCWHVVRGYWQSVLGQLSRFWSLSFYNLPPSLLSRPFKDTKSGKTYLIFP